ncbi:MAG: hypothetical protein WC222_04825 [Parachlamydiales bacterium]|jgi:hypothetical protein
MGITGNLTQGLNQGIMADQNISATQKILKQDANETIKDAQIADVNADDTLKDTELGSERNASVAKAATKGSEKAAKDKDIKKAMQSRVNQAAEKAEKGGDVKSKPSGQLQDKANEFAAKTAGELPSSTLLSLNDGISDRESPKRITDLVENKIRKDRKTDLPEHHLVSEALKFLVDNASGERKKNLQQAFDDHYAEHKKEIDYGLTVGVYAREIAIDKNGNVSSIRQQINNMMREDVTTHEIYDGFDKAYGTSTKVFSKMKVYLNYLGDETKKKGIEPANLLAVNTCVRKLQAVKGVYDREITNFDGVLKQAAALTA